MPVKPGKPGRRVRAGQADAAQREPAPATQSSGARRTVRRVPARYPARHEWVTPLSVSDYAILGLLTFGEKSGWDLWQFAERSIGMIWAPAKSQVYRVLPKLTKLGLSTARRVKQTNYPDKHIYRLTPSGRAAFEGWLEIIDAAAAPELYLLKIFFGREARPPILVAQIDAYRGAMAEALAAYELLDGRLERKAANRYPLQVLELGMRRCRASLEWADELRGEVARVPLGGAGDETDPVAHAGDPRARRPHGWVASAPRRSSTKTPTGPGQKTWQRAGRQRRDR